ncbi:MAG: hypothetical protein IJS58_06735 [Bacilli bacterium]|nr:hypothetical protein [Bacilli bacterium]
MAFNLINVFNKNDLIKNGQSFENIVSLAFKTNSKNGNRTVRAVLDNGQALIKTVTQTGVEISKAITISSFNSVKQRNDIIKDLSKQKFNQEDIAAMMDLSQSTVSNVLRKK